MTILPRPVEGTEARILATTDLDANAVPLATSYGTSGTLAGIVELLDRERERQPTVWLDVAISWSAIPPTRCWANGPGAMSRTCRSPRRRQAATSSTTASTRCGGRARALLPAAVRQRRRRLPPSALIGTAAGGIGVIGLTSPNSHRYSRAPAPAADWPQRVGELARELCGGGARWVVALLHDGVEWWPADPIASAHGRATSSRRAERVMSADWAVANPANRDGHRVWRNWARAARRAAAQRSRRCSRAGHARPGPPSGGAPVVGRSPTIRERAPVDRLDRRGRPLRSDQRRGEDVRLAGRRAGERAGPGGEVVAREDEVDRLWCRMPAASTGAQNPTSAAMIPRRHLLTTAGARRRPARRSRRRPGLNGRATA